MAERILTLRDLNRTTLLRQLLLRRERLPVARAIERVAALQAQWAPAPYVALWSRLEGFERQALERALVRRTVVKALLMRATMHLVSARDYAWFDASVRETRTLVRVRGRKPPPPSVVERALALTRERPHTRPELMRALATNRGRRIPMSCVNSAGSSRSHDSSRLRTPRSGPSAARRYSSRPSTSCRRTGRPRPT